MTQKAKQISLGTILSLFLACLGTSGASYYKSGATENQVQVNKEDITEHKTNTNKWQDEFRKEYRQDMTELKRLIRGY